MKLYQILLAGSLMGALLNVPAASAADPYLVAEAPDRRLYLAVSSGWNYADSDLFEIPSIPLSGEIFFMDGWAGAVALGGHITDHVRTEFELAVHHNALDDEDIVGLGTIDLEGEINVYTGLAKIAYDFGEGPLKPYIAAGVGLAKFDVEINSPVTGSDSDLVLAGSLEAGVNYAVTANMELFADGQVLMLDDVTIDPAGGGAADLSNPMFISASVGLRWNF